MLEEREEGGEGADELPGGRGGRPGVGVRERIGGGPEEAEGIDGAAEGEGEARGRALDRAKDAQVAVVAATEPVRAAAGGGG